MATIRITDDQLVIEMHGMDKIWALRSSLSVPLSHVRTVELRPKDAHIANMKGPIRVGSYVPGHVLAGYLYMTGGVGPNAAAIFENLEQARHAIEEWPAKSGTPREPGHRDQALEHLAAATEAMRAAAAEAGIDPRDHGRGWTFYEAHDPNQTIGMDVSGERVRRIVVEVQGQTPEEAVAMIEAALRKR